MYPVLDENDILIFKKIYSFIDSMYVILEKYSDGSSNFNIVISSKFRNEHINSESLFKILIKFTLDKVTTNTNIFGKLWQFYVKNIENFDVNSIKKTTIQKQNEILSIFNNDRNILNSYIQHLNKIFVINNISNIIIRVLEIIVEKQIPKFIILNQEMKLLSVVHKKNKNWNIVFSEPDKVINKRLFEILDIDIEELSKMDDVNNILTEFF